VAKKTTRQRKELSRQRAVQQAAANVSAATAPSATAPTAPAPPVSAQVSVESGGEYAHVYSDLRRIAILAGGIIAVLVVLSFVLA